jgi:hypothetical protein
MNIADWQTLPPKVQEILEKYRIISEQERTKGGQTIRAKGYTSANLRAARDAEGRILGDGYMLNLDVVRRFIEADTLGGDYEWLDWMLFHCGGGVEGQRRSTQSLEQTMDRFIDERVRGYRDTSGKYHPAVPKAEAEAKWALSRNKFRDVLMIGDQDTVEKLHVFGFHRNWPGHNKAYENATKAVKTFLELLPKTKEMNSFMARNGSPAKIVKIKPKDYATVEALDEAIKKIERFYASKAAREDIRIEKIYEDDYLEIACPITYAAAVRYGWDGWPFANSETFETNLDGTGNKWSDAWRKTLKDDDSVIVYIRFHVAVPSWVSYDKAKFTRFTMENIALLIKKKQLRVANPWSVPVMDEENRPGMTLQHMCEFIRSEPKRVYDPAIEEYPVHVGPPVYQSEAEANNVVNHLIKGVEVLQDWAKKFDPKALVVDYMPETR